MSTTAPPTIVKVQRALTGPTAGTSRCLVYEYGRRNMVEQSVDETALAALGEDAKGYFEAQWIGLNTGWQIGRRVEAQDW